MDQQHRNETIVVPQNNVLKSSPTQGKKMDQQHRNETIVVPQNNVLGSSPTQGK